MDRVLALLLALLVAGLASGCFVIDEIDDGMKFVNEHSDADLKAKKEAEAAAKAEREANQPGLLDRAKSWVSDHAGSGASAPKVPEVVDDGPPPAPENVPVQCEIGGSVSFTRKFDCQLRGGKVLKSMEHAKR